MSSPAGNRTPVSRVTGGDTNHYTTEDLVTTINFRYLTLTAILLIYSTHPQIHSILIAVGDMLSATDPSFYLFVFSATLAN